VFLFKVGALPDRRDDVEDGAMGVDTLGDVTVLDVTGFEFLASLEAQAIFPMLALQVLADGDFLVVVFILDEIHDLLPSVVVYLTVPVTAAKGYGVKVHPPADGVIRFEGTHRLIPPRSDPHR